VGRVIDRRYNIKQVDDLCVLKHSGRKLLDNTLVEVSLPKRYYSTLALKTSKQQQDFETRFMAFCVKYGLDQEGQEVQDILKEAYKLSSHADVTPNLTQCFDNLKFASEQVKKELLGALNDLKLELKQTLQQHENRIEELECEKKLTQTKLDVFDLSRLFSHYFVEPKEKWSSVVDKVSIMKAKLADNEITRDVFDKYIVSRNKTYGVDVVELCQVGSQRHGIAHRDLRAAAEQLQFLQVMDSYRFPQHYEHTQIVKMMVQKLKTVKFSRRRNK